MTDGSLKGRIALVTGASRGIGRAVGVALAAEGAHVILVARTVGGLESVDDEIKALGGTATLVPMDIREADGMDRLGANVHERWKKLDILVGNAGILGTLTPVGHISPKQWQDLLDINLTANWRLIRAFDVLLRQSDAGRVIFVTSGAAHNHKPFWGGYAITKAALESLALTYAAECEKTPINVNLINPGPLRTSMRAMAMPGEDAKKLKTPEDIAPLFVEMSAPAYTKSGAIIDFQ